MTERTQPVDLSARRRIHVVAVGGYAMSAIARYFTQLGHEVTGCDVTDSPMLVALADEGVEVSLGHSVDHVVEGQAFISVTSAVGPEHIDTLILTGGSTRVPAVASVLRRQLPAARPVETDAFGSVGLGLALDALRRFG